MIRPLHPVQQLCLFLAICAAATVYGLQLQKQDERRSAAMPADDELAMARRAMIYFKDHGEPGAWMSLTEASHASGNLAICGKFSRAEYPATPDGPDAIFIYSQDFKRAFSINDPTGRHLWVAYCADGRRPGDDGQGSPA